MTFDQASLHRNEIRAQLAPETLDRIRDLQARPRACVEEKLKGLLDSFSQELRTNWVARARGDRPWNLGEFRPGPESPLIKILASAPRAGRGSIATIPLSSGGHEDLRILQRKTGLSPSILIEAAISPPATGLGLADLLGWKGVATEEVEELIRARAIPNGDLRPSRPLPRAIHPVLPLDAAGPASYARRGLGGLRPTLPPGGSIPMGGCERSIRCRIYFQSCDGSIGRVDVELPASTFGRLPPLVDAVRGRAIADAAFASPGLRDEAKKLEARRPESLRGNPGLRRR